MDPPATFEACDLARLGPRNVTNPLAQVKVMTKLLKAASLVLVVLVATGSPLPARSLSDERPVPRARDGVQSSSPAGQGKTVVLDVPTIAERVNEVVVNVRSSSESGENLGSGFIIDQRG
jgi:hypothetical protein